MKARAIYYRNERIYLCARCKKPLVSRQDVATYFYMFRDDPIFDKDIFLTCPGCGLGNVIGVDKEIGNEN